MQTDAGESRELAPVSISAAEGAALCDAVIAAGATRTVEVGLGYGIATLFMCEGLLHNGSDVRHVVIDPFQHESLPGESNLFGGAGVRALQRAGVRALVELYEEPSELVLPRMLSSGRRFDFAFIDGSPRFENVFSDLVFSGRLLAEGDPVFVDDSHEPAIAHAVAYCTTNLGWTVQSTGAHWTVLRNGPPVPGPFTPW